MVDQCRKHLPSISGAAFDDPRTDLVIADGTSLVAETEEKFDLVIVDSTDPVGPGVALFQKEFYTNFRRCLNEKGILVTQNGVPFLQSSEFTDAHRRLKPLFDDVTFYLTAVPTYVGGFMALGWASLDAAHRRVSRKTLKTRFTRAAIKTRYYSPAVHLAAFALPAYIAKSME